MKYILDNYAAKVLSVIVAATLLAPITSAELRPGQRYPNSIFEVPVSLELGTIRTPEFSTKKKLYWIMIQVEKPLPLLQMDCMLGTTAGPLDEKDCRYDYPLLRGDWKILQGDQTIAQGSIPFSCSCDHSTRYIEKHIGKFSGEVGKKYVIEMTFTRDGTPLNVAKPYLIIAPVVYE